MSKPYLLILIGPPCSGKTTWAKDYIARNPGVVRVGRDDIKQMLFGKLKTDDIENGLIREVAYKAIYESLVLGYNVIIDQTNCQLRTIANLVKTFGDCSEIRYRVFNEALDLLKRRNQLRAFDTHIPPIPDKEIEHMHGWLERALTHDDLRKLMKNGRSVV